MNRELLGKVTYDDDEVSFTIDPDNQCGELFIAIPIADDYAVSQVGRVKVNSQSATFYGPDNVTSSISLPYNGELMDMLIEVEEETESFTLDTSNL